MLKCKCNKRVVVTGMGVVTPIGNTIDDFANNLFAGKSGIVPITRFDEKEYSWFKRNKGMTFFAAGQVEEPDVSMYDSRQIKRVARFVRYALGAAQQAFDPHLFSPGDDPYRAGVIIGNGAGGQEEGEFAQARIMVDNKMPRPTTVPQRMANGCSGKLAQLLKWELHGEEFHAKGDNYVVASACASATHAIGESFRKIRDGYLDVVITGGCEAPITGITLPSFDIIRAMSTNEDYAHASRPFDLKRDGFMIGEGAGILVLEELEHATLRSANIVAEIVGYGATDDAYDDVKPDPDAEGMANAMIIALKDAGVGPFSVKYINAHGTSTPLNDATETKAIKKVFCDHAYDIAISSTKSMTGHLMGAAGAVEAIATILALQRGVLPPTINLETPDPACDLDYVPNEARKVDNLEYALSNSFGFTGHNASLVLKKY